MKLISLGKATEFLQWKQLRSRLSRVLLSCYKFSARSTRLLNAPNQLKSRVVAHPLDAEISGAKISGTVTSDSTVSLLYGRRKISLLSYILLRQTLANNSCMTHQGL